MEPFNYRAGLDGCRIYLPSLCRNPFFDSMASQNKCINTEHIHICVYLCQVCPICFCGSKTLAVEHTEPWVVGLEAL